jgi:hypothetical protein
VTLTPKLSAGLLLAALAGVWTFSGAEPPLAAEPTLRPTAAYTHDNLSVYLLRGPETFDASNVLTLQEALDAGVAVVHETSNVNQLAVENLSPDREVFLQSGDIVKGGKQDRLIAKDMLLPPKSGRVAIGANCCEHNRWTGRGAECPTKFEKSTDFAVGNAIKLANASGAQPTVWSNVEATQRQLSSNLGKSVTENASPTSLQLCLEDKDLAAKVAAYEKALAGVAKAYPDAVGVVIAVNGQVIAADVYGSNELFQKLWPKLLKSAAVDALAQMPKDGVIAKTPALAEVEKFLASSATPRSEANVVIADGTDGLALGSPPTVLNVTDAQVELRRSPQLSNAAPPGNATLFFATVDAPSDRIAGSNPANQPTAGADFREQTRTIPQTIAFRGRGGATVSRSMNAAGGIQPESPDSTAQVGVVVLESQVASQPGRVIHRSILKK